MTTVDKTAKSNVMRGGRCARVLDHVWACAGKHIQLWRSPMHPPVPLAEGEDQQKKKEDAKALSAHTCSVDEVRGEGDGMGESTAPYPTPLSLALVLDALEGRHDAKYGGREHARRRAVVALESI